MQRTLPARANSKQTLGNVFVGFVVFRYEFLEPKRRTGSCARFGIWHKCLYLSIFLNRCPSPDTNIQRRHRTLWVYSGHWTHSGHFCSRRCDGVVSFCALSCSLFWTTLPQCRSRIVYTAQQCFLCLGGATVRILNSTEDSTAQCHWLSVRRVPCCVLSPRCWYTMLRTVGFCFVQQSTAVASLFHRVFGAALSCW